VPEFSPAAKSRFAGIDFAQVFSSDLAVQRLFLAPGY
jgi:hypothetical protein